MLRTMAFMLMLGWTAMGWAQTADTVKELPADTGPAPYADKLLYRPTPVPDRIILTWKSDPATSQAVTWRTDTSVTTPIAEIAISEEASGFDNMNNRKGPRPDPEKVTRVKGTSTPLQTDLNPCHYHSAEFTNLKPDTKYVYRVGQMGETKGMNWSEWFQFRTPKKEAARLQFIYFGDAQNELKSHWSRVVRGAYSDMPGAHFILHAGDLINRANADGEWGEWHYAAGWINGQVPSIATPGNHEYAAPPKKRDVVGAIVDAVKPDGKITRPKSVLSAHWRPGFAFPENGPKGLEETVYYLDIQGVRIISLNSNEQQEQQVEWLEQTLANNPNKWTVVTFHHPMYSTASNRQKEEQGKSVRKFWRPLFDKYGVDLVLQGHDHSYGRSGLMKEDNTLSGMQVFTSKGTVYAVSVSGPKMYELGVQPWMVEKAEKKQLYQLISIDGNKLHYRSLTANGVVFDEFELRKRKDGGNTIVEREELSKEREAPAAESKPTRTELAIALIAMVTLAISFGLWKVITRTP